MEESFSFFLMTQKVEEFPLRLLIFIKTFKNYNLVKYTRLYQKNYFIESYQVPLADKTLRDDFYLESENHTLQIQKIYINL